MSKFGEIKEFVEYTFRNGDWHSTYRVYQEFVENRGFKKGTVANALYKLRKSGDLKRGFYLINKPTLRPGRAKDWRKVYF
ncbi:hypothetical protein LIX87_05940 [Weissella viridescens]|uniref:hypothetical protein n=1 Tax=Weissella viridescens TaxID=1629 RepID=UPI001D08B72C|nr:hypothetical protein [Weissella viridescens]MCB6840619.1 hypothetical protein [Weissella viridescens]MCB6847273.1 hypothetical protein [Weissella viridescens]